MIRMYAQIAAVVLVAVVAGVVVLGWSMEAVFYHSSLALLYGYVGLFAPDHVYVRQMVMGLGVLVLAVKAVEVLVSWSVSGCFLHGPIEISCLVVGTTSILAAKYLPDDGPRS
jgi:hypothetical protein